MRHSPIHYAMLVTMSLALVACSDRSPQPRPAATSTPAGAAAADPLESFKALVAKCEAAVVNGTTVTKLPAAYAATTVTVGDKRFDVKKTDSLVTPFTAYIDLRFLAVMHQSAPTEEQARTSPVVVGTDHHWRLNYAFQDGKWKLQEEVHAFGVPTQNIAMGAPSKMNIGDLAGIIAAASACYPS